MLMMIVESPVVLGLDNTGAVRTDAHVARGLSASKANIGAADAHDACGQVVSFGCVRTTLEWLMLMIPTVGSPLNCVTGADEAHDARSRVALLAGSG